MKLSFSTRGWAHLNWETWLDNAVEMDFEGVEVYNLPKFPALSDRGAPFHKYNIAATVRALREKKLSMPCVDTSYDISAEEDVLPQLKELMEIAGQMQVPYIVVVALTENEDRVRERLEQLLPIRTRVTGGQAVALCADILPGLCPEPEDGWLSFCCRWQ